MKITVSANLKADYGAAIDLMLAIEPGDGEQYRNVRRIPNESRDVEAVAAKLEELAKWLRGVARLDPEVLAKMRR